MMHTMEYDGQTDKQVNNALAIYCQKLVDSVDGPSGHRIRSMFRCRVLPHIEVSQ
jgi:hypothetical protein